MRSSLAVTLAVLTLTAVGQAGDWPQFRGPGGRGMPEGNDRYPAEIGPGKNEVWRVALPTGHSSPAIVGDRIYLTGVRDKKLLTIALDRANGKVIWEQAAPYEKLEKIHAIGSYAQPTPATDGKHVVSFFGSSGLLCYDRDGKLLWHRRMGPFKNEFGAGSSPILSSGRVILSEDHDEGSFVMAADVDTGEVVWKTDRAEFPAGNATPVVWEVGGKKQVVVAGTLRVVGYDFETGKEVWTVRGLSRIVNMTPTVGPDNILYVTGWTSGADADDRITVPAWAAMLRDHDRNNNGTLEREEVTLDALKRRYNQIDRDRNEHVTRAEYEGMRNIFATAKNRIVAIKPGGKGDITKTHVLWEHGEQLPYVPSPLVVGGLVFMVKNNGIVTALDAKTGEVTRRARAGGVASYYASPVAADGKVYLLSERGHVTVISAERKWKVLFRSRFPEDTYATPALVDGKVYLRTTGHLYCFGK
jgi:outer membrane protein assembly factor BamB